MQDKKYFSIIFRVTPVNGETGLRYRNVVILFAVLIKFDSFSDLYSEWNYLNAADQTNSLWDHVQRIRTTENGNPVRRRRPFLKINFAKCVLTMFRFGTYFFITKKMLKSVSQISPSGSSMGLVGLVLVGLVHAINVHVVTPGHDPSRSLVEVQSGERVLEVHEEPPRSFLGLEAKVRPFGEDDFDDLRWRRSIRRLAAFVDVDHAANGMVASPSHALPDAPSDGVLGNIDSSQDSRAVDVAFLESGGRVSVVRSSGRFEPFSGESLDGPTVRKSQDSKRPVDAKRPSDSTSSSSSSGGSGSSSSAATATVAGRTAATTSSGSTRGSTNDSTSGSSSSGSTVATLGAKRTGPSTGGTTRKIKTSKDLNPPSVRKSAEHKRPTNNSSTNLKNASALRGASAPPRTAAAAAAAAAVVGGGGGLSPPSVRTSHEGQRPGNAARPGPPTRGSGPEMRPGKAADVTNGSNVTNGSRNVTKAIQDYVESFHGFKITFPTRRRSPIQITSSRRPAPTAAPARAASTDVLYNSADLQAMLVYATTRTRVPSTQTTNSRRGSKLRDGVVVTSRRSNKPVKGTIAPGFYKQLSAVEDEIVASVGGLSAGADGGRWKGWARERMEKLCPVGGRVVAGVSVLEGVLGEGGEEAERGREGRSAGVLGAGVEEGLEEEGEEAEREGSAGMSMSVLEGALGAGVEEVSEEEIMQGASVTSAALEGGEMMSALRSGKGDGGAGIMSALRKELKAGGPVGQPKREQGAALSERKALETASTALETGGERVRRRTGRQQTPPSPADALAAESPRSPTSLSVRNPTLEGPSVRHLEGSTRPGDKPVSTALGKKHSANAKISRRRSCPVGLISSEKLWTLFFQHSRTEKITSRELLDTMKMPVGKNLPSLLLPFDGKRMRAWLPANASTLGIAQGIERGELRTVAKPIPNAFNYLVNVHHDLGWQLWRGDGKVDDRFKSVTQKNLFKVGGSRYG